MDETSVVNSTALTPYVPRNTKPEKHKTQGR